MKQNPPWLNRISPVVRNSLVPPWHCKQVALSPGMALIDSEAWESKLSHSSILPFGSCVFWLLHCMAAMYPCVSFRLWQASCRFLMTLSRAMFHFMQLPFGFTVGFATLSWKSRSSCSLFQCPESNLLPWFYHLIRHFRIAGLKKGSSWASEQCLRIWNVAVIPWIITLISMYVRSIELSAWWQFNSLSHRQVERMSGSNTSDCSWQANEAGQVANTEGNGNGLPCPLRSGQATTETLLGSTRLKCLAAVQEICATKCKTVFSTNTNMISYMRYMRQSQRPRTTVKQGIFSEAATTEKWRGMSSSLPSHLLPWPFRPSTVATWQLTKTSCSKNHQV